MRLFFQHCFLWGIRQEGVINGLPPFLHQAAEVIALKLGLPGGGIEYPWCFAPPQRLKPMFPFNEFANERNQFGASHALGFSSQRVVLAKALPACFFRELKQFQRKIIVCVFRFGISLRMSAEGGNDFRGHPQAVVKHIRHPPRPVANRSELRRKRPLLQEFGPIEIACRTAQDGPGEVKQGQQKQLQPIQGRWFGYSQRGEHIINRPAGVIGKGRAVVGD